MKDAAPVSTVVRLIQQHQGLRTVLSRPPMIIRDYFVPYGSGPSMDGHAVYVDSEVPERFKMGVEPDRYVAGHEIFEWYFMTRQGMPYWRNERGAHWLAEGYEHYRMKLDGWSDDDIEAYEAEWLTYIAQDEAQRLTPDNVPMDLFTGPYEPGMDDDPVESRLDEKILPILLAARGRAMPVRAAG